MKKILMAAIGLLFAYAGNAQSSDVERSYYLDISVGYDISLAPFSNGNTTALLKPHNGGSMSFSFMRTVGDNFGLQIEVLSTVFNVKTSDFRKVTTGINPTQISLTGYNSTFFGVGCVKTFPVSSTRLKLDLKGSVGLNMAEYAKQKYVDQVVDKADENVSFTAKRSFAPGALVGCRLRFPIGETVDLGAKVEYGISNVSFDVSKTSSGQSSSNPSETVTSLGKSSKTLTYFNSGITLGVRF